MTVDIFHKNRIKPLVPTHIDTAVGLARWQSSPYISGNLCSKPVEPPPIVPPPTRLYFTSTLAEAEDMTIGTCLPVSLISKGHSPTPGGACRRFFCVALIDLVVTRDRKSTVFLTCNCRIDHRCRRVIDVVENPEEFSCWFVVPGERGVIHAGGVHQNKRKMVRRNVETEDSDPIRTLHKEVRRVCYGLLGAIRRRCSIRDNLCNGFHFDPMDYLFRLPLILILILVLRPGYAVTSIYHPLCATRLTLLCTGSQLQEEVK